MLDILWGYQLWITKLCYGIKDGMARDLWSDFSFSDSKGKNSSGSYKPREVGAISSFRQRPPRP